MTQCDVVEAPAALPSVSNMCRLDHRAPSHRPSAGSRRRSGPPRPAAARQQDAFLRFVQLPGGSLRPVRTLPPRLLPGVRRRHGDVHDVSALLVLTSSCNVLVSAAASLCRHDGSILLHPLPTVVAPRQSPSWSPFSAAPARCSSPPPPSRRTAPRQTSPSTFTSCSKRSARRSAAQRRGLQRRRLSSKLDALVAIRAAALVK